MKFWIKKENDADPDVEWKDSYILTLNRDSGSTIYSGLPSIWYHLGCQKMVPIYEDLFVIGLSVFALDKRIARNLFSDSWTRQIEVSIPVLEMDKWNNCEAQWNKILSFLTGDEWKISFRQATTEYGTHKNSNRKHIDVSGCDCVSLFSGGLDSYCGAIKLLLIMNIPNFGISKNDFAIISMNAIQYKNRCFLGSQQEQELHSV